MQLPTTMLSSESSSERGDSGATSRVETHSDYPDRFVPGGVVYLDDERCVIHRVHNHKVGYVVGPRHGPGQNVCRTLAWEDANSTRLGTPRTRRRYVFPL